MSSLKFYVADDDFFLVSQVLFDKGFVIHESCSFDRELIRFKTIDELYVAYKDEVLPQKLSLRLYHPSVGGKILIRRSVTEDNGFRYDIEGWGIIVFQLGSALNGSIGSSYFAHNTEKRAEKWNSTYPRLGNYLDWNWTELDKLSRSLQNQIKKLGVEKHGARPVLPCAASLLHQHGFSLQDD